MGGLHKTVSLLNDHEPSGIRPIAIDSVSGHTYKRPLTIQSCLS